MALIKCRDCGKDCSSSAARCPHCAAVKPAVGKVEYAVANVGATILAPIVLLLFGGWIFFLFAI